MINTELKHPEHAPLTPKVREAVIQLMRSYDGNAYENLIDLKAEMIKNELYTMLAELRDLEEKHDCPIIYKYIV
tara:strand:+ start:8416 stop:8637 length:222 start_codon:yes stop_codon:yes gene_type:complete